MTHGITINQIVLYNIAVCNLKCKYCYISKNPGLELVEEEIDKAFADPNYYYNLFINYTGQKGTTDLEEINIFGGETLLKFQRCIPTIKTFIDNCPNIDTFFLYSNFTTDNSIPALWSLFDLLKQYPTREFKIDLQISLDGPKEITDPQRGEGVTDRIFANLNTLLNKVDYIPDNVVLGLHPKATLSHEIISQFLDIDYLINYYKFFEDNFYIPVIQQNSPKLKINYWCIPTIANPWQATKEDGHLIKQLIEVFNELELRDQKEHLFKYKTFTLNWFYKPGVYNYLYKNDSIRTPFCPIGFTNLGLLPENKYCLCSQVFPAYCENYNKAYKAGYISGTHMLNSGVDKDMISDNQNNIITYTKRISQFNNNDFSKSEKPTNTALVSYCVNLVQQLAKVNQVDNKYQDYVLAEQAVQILLNYYNICACQNIIDGGHEMLLSAGAFKEFLNGGIDALIESAKIVGNEENNELFGWK